MVFVGTSRCGVHLCALLLGWMWVMLTLETQPVLGAGNIFNDCTFNPTSVGYYGFTSVTYPNTAIGNTSRINNVCSLQTASRGVTGYHKCWAGYAPPHEGTMGMRARCCQFALCNATGCLSQAWMVADVQRLPSTDSTFSSVSIPPPGHQAWLDMYIGRTSSFAPASDPGTAPQWACSYSSCSHITQYNCNTRVWSRARANALLALLGNMIKDLNRAVNVASVTDGMVTFRDLFTSFRTYPGPWTSYTCYRTAIAPYLPEFNARLARMQGVVNNTIVELTRLQGFFQTAAELFANAGGYPANLTAAITALNAAEAQLTASLNGITSCTTCLNQLTILVSRWDSSLVNGPWTTLIGGSPGAAGGSLFDMRSKAWSYPWTNSNPGSNDCWKFALDQMNTILNVGKWGTGLGNYVDYNDYKAITNLGINYNLQRRSDENNDTDVTQHFFNCSEGVMTGKPAQANLPVYLTDLFANALGFPVTVLSSTQNELAADFEVFYVMQYPNQTSGGLVQRVTKEPCPDCAIFLDGCGMNDPNVDNVTIYVDSEDASLWDDSDSLIGAMSEFSKDLPSVNITSIEQVGSNSQRRITALIFYSRLICQACKQSRPGSLLMQVLSDGQVSSAGSNSRKRFVAQSERSVGAASGPVISKSLLFAPTTDLSLLHLASVPGISGPLIVVPASAAGGAVAGGVAAGVVVGATIGSIAGAVLLSATVVGGAVVAHKVILNRRRRQMQHSHPDVELEEQKKPETMVEEPEEHEDVVPENEQTQDVKRPQFSVQVMGNREHAGSLTMRNPVIATTQKN